MAFTSLATVGTAAAQSCVDNCGGSGGGCYCDTQCSSLGDCCSDYATACPGDSGGGDSSGGMCSCTDSGGNMSVGGDYMFAGPRTGYVMVPAAAFAVHHNAGYAGGYRWSAGGLTLGSGSTDTTAERYISAAVQIPDGATPTGLTCELFSHEADPSTGRLRLNLESVTFGAGAQSLASLDLSTGTERRTSATAATSRAMVGNENRMFVLFGTYRAEDTRTFPAFVGCRVTYTTDRLAP